MNMVEDMEYRALRALGNEERFEFMLKLLDHGKVYRMDYLKDKHMQKLKAGGLIVQRGNLHDREKDYVILTKYGKGLVRAVFEFEMDYWSGLRKKLVEQHRCAGIEKSK